MYYFCAKFKKSKMKKIILFLSVIVLSIVSCSKEDTPEPVVNPGNLIKRIENISNSPDGNTTTFITYNGNKISETSSTDGGVARKSIYTYNGDLISKRVSYNGTVLKETDDYVYNNNKLISVFNVENELNSQTNLFEEKKSKREYIYNTNGTITEQVYKFVNNAYVAETRTNVYTYSGGNCTKLVQNSSSSFDNGSGTLQTNTYEYTYIYEYDNKVNPINNITGFSKILFDEEFSANNVIKRISSSTSTTNGVPNTVFPASVRNFVLSYNANNLITESKYDFLYTTGFDPVVTETRTSFNRYFYE